MLMFCIPRELVESFKAKLKSGEITPEKLVDMTSKERHTFLGEILGESNAKSVNALFESKLLLKNQQLGIINWAKKVVGLKPEVLRDILSKVERMEKVLEPKELDLFLEDLASQRLGFDVTFSEAAKISELAKDISSKKEKLTEDLPDGSPERMEYGTSLALFKDYVGKLKLGEQPWKEYAQNPGKVITDVSGVAKSSKSTLDNSFFGRQGIKALYTNPIIWTKNFAKSWLDITRELKGKDAGIVVRADVLSRKNAVNGHYERMKLDIGIAGEEAFPSSLPSRVPGLGRLFKASESAFNNGALRMRADLADLWIDLAERQGFNLLDKEVARQRGEVINSLTGRGKTNWFTPEGQKKINVLMFSVKFLKSNFDILTQPFNPRLDPFVRRQAALNLAKIATGVAAINVLSSLLQDDGAVFDPRATNFARPRVPGTESNFDISGGLTSLITLGSRVMWTKHNGEWGHWMQNRDGKFTKLNAGSFGQYTGWDVLIDGLFSNKLSPLMGLLRDELRGKDFSNEAVTAVSAVRGLTEPIIISNWEQISKSKDAGYIFWLMILEGLGLSVSVEQPKKPKPIKF